MSLGSFTPHTQRAKTAVAALIIALAAAVISAVAMPLPASASTTTTVVAGTGTAGYSGDGGPATAAQFARPVAISASPSGDITVVDADNYRLRRFAPGGNITTVAGGAQNCAGVTDPGTPLGGFCNLYTGYAIGGGITQDGAGNTYVTEGGAIRRVDSSGAIYHYAGRYSGNSNVGDGPKFTFSVDPYEVHWSASTSELYFAESNSLRKVTADGNLTTFAGALNYGYIICSQPVDGSTALGSCLGPSGFAISGSDVYIADNGYYNGGRNTPSVWRLDSAGTLHLIASGLPTLGRIALTSSGDIFVSEMNSGEILKIPAGSNTASSYADMGTTVSDIATDPTGDLLVTSAATHRVYKVTTVSNIAPVVASIIPDAPSPTDPMLTRGVTITPVNNGAAIDHYEYGWASSSTATAPTTPIQSSATVHGRLSYASTTPDANWWLLGRAVGPAGSSSWISYAVHTPKRPKLIILGDSISSGHHKNSETAKTVCQDASYGYAPAFYTKWKANITSMSSAWGSGVTYDNLAISGFATQFRAGSGITGSVMDGGKDSCQRTGIAAPINSATSKLTLNQGSWNRVVVSAGVNDTNWTSVAISVVNAELGHLTGPPYADLTEAECGAIITSQWNGYSQAVVSSQTQGVQRIVSTLRGADSSVAITWLGYYNMSGTGGTVLHPNVMPLSCQTPTDSALTQLNTVISAALPTDAQFISTNLVIGTRSDYIQPLYAISAWLNGTSGKNPPGWPHPNQAGGQQIANLIPAS